MPPTPQYGMLSNLPALHVGNYSQVPHAIHLLYISDAGAIATQSAVGAITPGERARVSEEAAIHSLPAQAIVLDDGLVGHPKGAAGDGAPVGGI